MSRETPPAEPAASNLTLPSFLRRDGAEGLRWFVLASAVFHGLTAAFWAVGGSGVVLSALGAGLAVAAFALWWGLGRWAVLERPWFPGWASALISGTILFLALSPIVSPGFRFVSGTVLVALGGLVLVDWTAYALHAVASLLVLWFLQAQGHLVDQDSTRILVAGAMAVGLVPLVHLRRATAAARARSALELQEANAALARAVASRRVLLAGLGHDIRTPIAATSLSMDLVKAGVRGSVTSGQRTALEEVHHKLDEMVALANETLDRIRAEDGPEVGSGNKTAGRTQSEALLRSWIRAEHPGIAVLHFAMYGTLSVALLVRSGGEAVNLRVAGLCLAYLVLYLWSRESPPSVHPDVFTTLLLLPAAGNVLRNIAILGDPSRVGDLMTLLALCALMVRSMTSYLAWASALVGFWCFALFTGRLADPGGVSSASLVAFAAAGAVMAWGRQRAMVATAAWIEETRQIRSRLRDWETALASVAQGPLVRLGALAPEVERRLCALAREQEGCFSDSQRAVLERALESAVGVHEVVKGIAAQVPDAIGDEPAVGGTAEVGPVVSRVVAVLDAEADAARVRIEAKVPPGVHVAMPTSDLYQVVFNLMDNAVKFSPEGGQVTVEARVVDGWVELQVHDQGKGISPEDQGRMFDLFAQFGDGADRGGMGIGLPVVKRAVDRAGGSVELMAHAGPGAHIRVRVRAAAAE